MFGGGPGPIVQNWESGMDVVMVRCNFFRNFCPYYGGALVIYNAWPHTFSADAVDFVQNDGLIALHDMWEYTPLVTRAPISPFAEAC